jgi:outer membrane protein assembly complex protein YaeT
MAFHCAAESVLPRFLGDKVLRAKPAGQCGNRCGCGILLVCGLAAAMSGWSQLSAVSAAPLGNAPANAVVSAAGSDSLEQWEGLPVRGISFQGVAPARLQHLESHLSQELGAPLNADDMRKSLRQLFATGLFETIQVEGSRQQDGVALLFVGAPRTFIGTVTVDGAKGSTVNSQLLSVAQLEPGVRYTSARLGQALEQMRRTLAENGFHEPVITQTLTPHPEEQLVDIAFHVVSGPQARVGAVQVTGEPGMSVEEFRSYAHLRIGSLVDHDTDNRALAGVLKQYRGQERLEAEIKLESQQYTPVGRKTNFRFSANRGPVVRVLVEGANLDAGRIKRIIPVFEEGTVDDDLLNEGNRRLRDYYQRLGYFDVKVEHPRQPTTAGQVTIVYNVQLGPRLRIGRVSVAGNHYFDSDTLEQLLSVHAADSLDSHGIYSQSLVAADVSVLQAVYQNNGFSQVRVVAETGDAQPAIAAAPHARTAPFTVVYRIEEGKQLHVASVRLEGNEHINAASLMPYLNTVPGQLLSPQYLAGDRDALLTVYLSRGFDQVRVDVTQQLVPSDADRVDVVFHVTEGPQIFVRKVLLTGLHYTRPETVAKAITIHPGDPLNETALQQTQRNLYDFALFNEVDTAIENPSGAETYKTVLLQAVEARRWALTYGFGFEAQTGTPQNNCASAIAGGLACNPNGKTGVSPRVLVDLTRNNLFGREQSASIQATYGLLEQKFNLLFQNPHFEGNRNFGLILSGGYASSLDVTTYVASRLEASVRWTESFLTPGSAISKANTLVYEYNFRRVKVAASSLQVFPDEISLLSAAVRVAGPGVTWIRDTRDSPLASHRGTYTSFQDFFSSKPFGAEAEFNRLDLSNSSYYSFDRDRFVLARNTRYGQERAFGPPASELIPLPERIYAGGPTSLRGFSINAAGPRDPETGYPIGGAGALIESTELRLPPPTLPWLGNTVSFVLFHDMGNVFANAGDAWASALRLHQPNRDTCKILNDPPVPNPVPTGRTTSTGPQGACSFNYFVHAPGSGLRYHTPVGPIRLDFSYNLNPPIFPVNLNYSLPIPDSAPYVGQANHFNFFFSLGQTF